MLLVDFKCRKFFFTPKMFGGVGLNDDDWYKNPCENATMAGVININPCKFILTASTKTYTIFPNGKDNTISLFKKNKRDIFRPVRMIGNLVAGSNDIGYLHPAPWRHLRRCVGILRS